MAQTKENNQNENHKVEQRRRSNRLSHSAKRKVEEEEVKVDTASEGIRFGALEIVAVYIGEEDDELTDGKVKEPYGFVLLSNDIMEGDKDTESTFVQWLEYNDKKDIEMVDLEMHEISIGAIICAVTNDLVELSDGTYKVPDALYTSIEEKLKKQLSDDGENDEGPTYEMRMQMKLKNKGKRIKVKEEDDYDDVDMESEAKPKRGRKKRVKKEPSEGDSGDNEGMKKKRGKTDLKKPKTSKRSKAKLIPRNDIKLADNPWVKKTGKMNSFNGDTHRASKEAIRAYLSKDMTTFKKILKDDKVIADLFANQSCDVGMDVLAYAFVAEDEKMLKMLWGEMSKPSTSRPQFPECTLLELTSGKHTSKYADYNRYNVGASRGSKEGNNAFFADMSGSVYSRGRTSVLSNQDIVELLRTHDSISNTFVEFVDKEFFQTNLFSWGFNFQKLVAYGHQKFAQSAMKALLEMGVGLNQLHIDCLGDGHTIDKILSVSVEKMTNKHQTNVRFCPVHCAASNGNPTYLKQLLTVKPDAVNCKDSDEANLIHYAAVGEKPNTLKWLLEGPGASLDRNVKMRKGQKSTPLMWAVQAARAENVNVLCKGQPDTMFKVKDVSGQCAFHYVAYSSRKGRLDTAKALIECGADPNIHGDARLLNKQTPLMICAARGDLDLLKLLVEEGGGDLAKLDKLGRTPLTFAAKNGHPHILTYVLRAGIDVDAKDTSENTALHYAAAYGWVDCLKLLLEAGANVDLKNSWASTPLELALKKGRFACAVILLKEKVDVNVRDKNGVSLFNSLVSSYMTQLSRDKEAPLPWAIKKVMEREELDVTCVDSSDQTVLHHVAQGNATEAPLLDLIDQLLLRGVDPLIKSKDSFLAAELALQSKNFVLCLKLLKHSPHTYQDTHKDGTTLMHLLMQNITEVDETVFMEIFSLLQDSTNGELIKCIDSDGYTPLMLASQNIRENWNKFSPKGRGKDALDKLFDLFPERLGDVSSRREKFRKWSEDLFKDGKPTWSFDEEYANGSRTVLHDILQCPDVGWALKISSKIFNQKILKSIDILKLKTNDGKDALAFALETFIHEEAPVNQTLKLIQLLCGNGANMNSVQHPLFSSLSEAKEEVPEILFNAMDCCIQDAFDYVRYNAKKAIQQMHPSDAFLQRMFTPRLLQILNREKSRRPSPEFLRKLLETSMLSLNVTDMNGNTALHVVKDLKIVKELIPFSDINAVNNEGKSALHLAIDHDSLAKLLITNGADVNIACEEGAPLHIAVKGGNSEMVEKLLETCQVDITDRNGRTALHFAVALRAVSNVEMINPIENQLLIAGADVNATDKYGRAPLHYCFVPIDVDTVCHFPPSDYRDPIDMVTALAGKHDLDFDKTDNDMRTPLHYAAAVGASICVLYLCERSGKAVHSFDFDKNTPLALALRAERADTSTILISKNSSLEVQVHDIKRTRNEHGIVEEVSRKTCSTLWFALKGADCQSVARYMLAANKFSMNTILSSLLSTGNFQLMMQQIKLCGAKEKLQIPDKETGMTGLHCLGRVESFANAPEFGPALADVMVDYGINVESKSKDGSTVLHEASYRGHIGLCSHLISSHGAIVDVKDAKGQSPLARMFNGNNDSVQLLNILAGASKDASALVNTQVEGKFCEANENDWRNRESVGEFLLATSDSHQHSEEFFIQKLKEESNSDKKHHTKLATTIFSTPLIQSVLKNDSALTNSLLSFGADISGTDENGRTALHHAVISKKSSMLDLLLKWDSLPLNMIDVYGRSALSYVVLDSSEDAITTKHMLEILLSYGADPLVGNAIEKAIKLNKGINLIETMIKSSHEVQPQSCGRKKYKEGDEVWVRYQNNHNNWELATVLSNDGVQLKVIPKKNKNEAFVVGLSVQALNHRYGDFRKATIKKAHTNDTFDIEFMEEYGYKHFQARMPKDRIKLIATELDGVSKAKDQYLESIIIKGTANWGICAVKMQHDMVTEDIEEDLLPLLCNTESSLEDKRSLIKEYKGNECGLQIKAGPRKKALVSKLSLGDDVGYLVSKPSMAPKLHVGKVKGAHANGLYDIDFKNGLSLKQVSRIHLRPLRKELLIATKPKSLNLGANLVHACIRPTEYGSYEDLDLLKMMIELGAPADGANEKGETPLDLARPGSEIQKYLQDITNSKQGRPLPSPMSTILSSDEVDLQKDADTEQEAMFSDGAENSEPVIPKVSSVCELDSDGTRVLDDGDDFFDVALTKVDVEYGQYGKYVFYKMQVIYDPIRETYVLLTNWGRIGEGGKYQQTPFTSKDDCTKEFKKVFKSKSGNEWDTRVSFERKPGKYALVKRPRTRLKDPESLFHGIIDSSDYPCSLSENIEDLFKFLLDAEELTSAYSRSNIDSSQVPFGQLALSTIQAAERKISEIKQKLTSLKEMSENGKSLKELKAAHESVAKSSSEFYELLPMGRDMIVKPFDDESLGQAVNLTRELRDLTLTKQLLLGAKHLQGSMNPVDYAYKALGVNIESIDVDSIEHKCLMRYVDNTFSDGNTLIRRIYSLNDGKEACNIPNKRLLFHGSKNRNVPGILKHGLQIAPPEAPISGWAYGKGVYFADQFDKAIQYASWRDDGSYKRPRAFVFVAEVALGESYFPSECEYMEKSPEGTQSTLAMGEKSPSKSQNLILDGAGACIPLGKLVENQSPCSSKVHWSTGKHESSWYHRWNNISDEDTAKVEKLRSDPSTKYPATVKVEHNGSKYVLKLQGPQCEFGHMIPCKDGDDNNINDDEDEDEEMKEDEDEEMKEDEDESQIRIDLATRNDSSRMIKLYRHEQDGGNNHVTSLSEFIVYDTKQIRLKYLIEVTSAEWVKNDFKKKNPSLFIK